MAADEQHELGGEEPFDDEPEQPAGDGGETSLSQHPEAVRARRRRKEGRGGGKKSTSSSSSSGRRKSSSSLDVRVRLAESIAEIAGWLEGRDDELAGVLRRDGPKQAELLGKWADHPAAPPGVKVAILVVAELLEPVRAFGATFRLILRRIAARRARRQEYDEQPAQPWEVDQDQLVEEPIETSHVADLRGTPERFRA